MEDKNVAAWRENGVLMTNSAEVNALIQKLRNPPAACGEHEWKEWLAADLNRISKMVDLFDRRLRKAVAFAEEHGVLVERTIQLVNPFRKMCYARSLAVATPFFNPETMLGGEGFCLRVRMLRNSDRLPADIWHIVSSDGVANFDVTL